MIRIITENVLLFLLPTAAYVAYAVLKSRGQTTGSVVLSDAPLAWLFTAGAVLVVTTLLAFGTFSGGKPGQHYEPAVLKDGKIEPGRIN